MVCGREDSNPSRRDQRRGPGRPGLSLEDVIIKQRPVPEATWGTMIFDTDVG